MYMVDRNLCVKNVQMAVRVFVNMVAGNLDVESAVDGHYVNIADKNLCVENANEIRWMICVNTRN